MKTTLKIVSSTVIAVTLIIGLTGQVLKPSTPKGAKKTDAKICHTCNRDDFKPVSVTQFMMDVVRYKNTHVSVVQPGLDGFKKKASRSCWYSLDVLKELVCLIESEGKKQGITHNDLGIRFYFAVYPGKHKVEGIEYGMLHTLYMVPTQLRDGKNVDIGLSYPKNPDSNLKYPYTLEQLQNVDSTARVLMLHTSAMAVNASVDTTGATSYDMIKNQGQLCPPTCPTGFYDVMDTEYGSYPTYTSGGY